MCHNGREVLIQRLHAGCFELKDGDITLKIQRDGTITEVIVAVIDIDQKS